MDNQGVIRADNLSKCYQVYAKPIDRLKQSLWRGRRKYYSEFWALKNVSLRVEKGETVGIIGSNGSGKSTLLRMICGVLVPTTGRLDVNGRITALLELGAGFNPEFTGRENVFMNAAIMGMSRKETEVQFPKIEAFAGIGRFMDQPVKTYSSGMYVRLAFSVAIHVSPEILLIDEALSVGDIRFQQKCMARIKEFCETGTVIFVSHNMAAVTELCSKVIWVEKGTIRMAGAPKPVVNAYLQYMYEGDRKDVRPVESSGSPPAIWQNDTDLDGFKPIDKHNEQFGDHRVTIETIRLQSRDKTRGVAISGDAFEIGFTLRANETIEKPIAGYIVKDRLGREVLGDNTALMENSLKPLVKGNRYAFFFKFNAWPNLFAGEYTLSIAVSEGTTKDHVPCHWYQDVAVIDSVPLRMPGGLFSILDTSVDLRRIGN